MGCMRHSYKLKPKSGRVVCVAPLKPIIAPAPTYTCPDGYHQKDDMECLQSGPQGSWPIDQAGAACATAKACEAFEVQTDRLDSAMGCMRHSYKLKPKSGRVVCVAPLKPIIAPAPTYTCPDGYHQ